MVRFVIGAALLSVVACGSGDVTRSADPSSDLVNFESTWDTATGTSKEAVSDGGRWPSYWEFNNGAPVQLMSVVRGGPGGHNALRVQQRGGHFAAFVQIDDVVLQSRDYYVRFYMKNDDTSFSGDHVATVDYQNYGNLTFMRKSSGESGWTFVVSMYGCGGGWPIGHWGPPGALARDSWYRFEYFIHYVDDNHIQLHPRVYDSSGTLVYQAADFQQASYKRGGIWNGRDDWTLASYYAAGYTFCVEPNWTNDFALGNNGQHESVDTGRYWHFAALQIRSDRWPGPVGGTAR
jgi:hypothetical protein